MSTDKLCEIKDLTFSYGRNKVIRGLSAKIEEGRVTTLIGADGCGKTPLFNMMTKNLRPDSGSVLPRGKNTAAGKLKDFALRSKDSEKLSDMSVSRPPAAGSRECG